MAPEAEEIVDAKEAEEAAGAEEAAEAAPGEPSPPVHGDPVKEVVASPAEQQYQNVPETGASELECYHGKISKSEADGSSHC